MVNGIFRGRTGDTGLQYLTCTLTSHKKKVDHISFSPQCEKGTIDFCQLTSRQAVR